MVNVRMPTALACLRLTKLEDLKTLPQAELIEAVTNGFPAELVRELASRIDLTLEELAGLLRLTPRTLQRRLEEGTLSLGESERLWELAHLFFRAVEVLESEPSAVQWFKSPIQVLGGATPLSYAITTIGVRELEKILGRIEHGVFS